MCVIGIIKGKNTPRLTHLWPDKEDMFGHQVRSGLSFVPFWANDVQSLRAAVEENPAGQMDQRRPVLQAAAQSFTYTDNLNKSRSRKRGRGRKIGETDSPKEAGFRLLSLTSRRVRKSSAPCWDHSNTETQSLSGELTKFMSSFGGKAWMQEDAPQLWYTLGICFLADCCGKGREQIQKNIYTWRGGSAAAASAPNWTSRIDHLWQDTKQKTSSHALDHHTVISLSTFLTLSALSTYTWCKWKVKWAEIRKWRIGIRLLTWNKRLSATDSSTSLNSPTAHTHQTSSSTLSLHVFM